MHTSQNKTRSRRGFTLLLAALTASIALAIGSAIFEIAQKQVLLSSLSRDSQFAFYAADTGIECALYWDVRWNEFGPGAPNPSPPPLQCAGQMLTFTNSGGSPYYKVTITDATLVGFDANNYCVFVTVEKCTTGNFKYSTPNPLEDCTGGGTAVHTRIRSDGFSAKCSDISTSQTVLQRSIEVHL